jgi:glucosylceramidase
MAQYFVKFIEDYAAGIPIGAVTPQNEPSLGAGGTSYPGMTLPPAQEATLVADDLAPAFAAADLHTRIYADDNSWDQVHYANVLLGSPAASNLAGIAWHCYFGEPQNMDAFQAAYPAIDQIVDECSPEIRPLPTPEFLISSLRHWATAVAVWNVALDPAGGPVQPPNSGCTGCTGLITVSEHNHALRLGPKYYQLGQVSKFVAPGAVRIGSPSFVTYGVTASNIAVASPGLDDVAFLNPDGSKVLVTYNNGAGAAAFAVETDGRYFTYRLAPGAMATFVWDRPSAGTG